MEGTVKSTRDKGKGFIFVCDAEGTDYFCHKSSCARGVNFQALQEGDKVRFEPEEGAKGPRATELELA